MGTDDGAVADAVRKLRAECREGETVADAADRLIDAHELFEGKAFDTTVDCLEFVERAIRDQEPPFDPADMGDDDRERWLSDISETQRLLDEHGAYAVEVYRDR